MGNFKLTGMTHSITWDITVLLTIKQSIKTRLLINEADQQLPYCPNDHTYYM